MSCPNLHDGSAMFAHSPSATAAAVAAATRSGAAVLGEAEPDHRAARRRRARGRRRGGGGARAREHAARARRRRRASQRARSARDAGGLSGPPLHPVAVHWVAACRAALPTTPIVGVGGVRSARRGRRLRARRRGRGRGRHRVARGPPRAVEGAARDAAVVRATRRRAALGPERTARWLTRSSNGSRGGRRGQRTTVRRARPVARAARALGARRRRARASRRSRGPTIEAVARVGGRREAPGRVLRAPRQRRASPCSSACSPTARAAGLLVIGDAKRGDIPTTNDGYADAWLRDDEPAVRRRDDGLVLPRGGRARPGLRARPRDRPRRVRRRRELERRGPRGADRARRRAAAPSSRRCSPSSAAITRELDGDGAPSRCLGAVVGAQRRPEGLERFEGPVLVAGMGAQGCDASDVASLRASLCHDALAVNVARAASSAPGRPRATRSRSRGRAFADHARGDPAVRSSADRW